MKVAEIFRTIRMSQISIAKAQHRPAEIDLVAAIAAPVEIAAAGVDVLAAEAAGDADAADVTAAEAVDGMVVGDTAADATEIRSQASVGVWPLIFTDLHGLQLLRAATCVAALAHKLESIPQGLKPV